MEERDSLKIENEVQTKNLNSIISMIDTINRLLESLRSSEVLYGCHDIPEINYLAPFDILKK